MSQEPNKNPTRADQSPVTGAELAWIAVLLALCVMANSWLAGPAPEPGPVPKASAPAVVQSTRAPPLSASERPSRDRPDSSRERAWRDPSSATLPGF